MHMDRVRWSLPWLVLPTTPVRHTFILGLSGVAGSIHIAGAGKAPEDGFSGYAPYAPDSIGVARWGDYSAAVALWDGSIWAASEYIPSGPRTMLANWGTFVSHIIPDYDH